MEEDDQLSEASLWAGGLAARLRHAADGPEGAERQGAVELVNQALRRVEGCRRARYRRALVRELPGLNLPDAAESDSGNDLPPVQDLASWFSLVRALPATRRKELMHGLGQCRFSGEQAGSVTMPGDLREQFGLPATVTVDRPSWLLLFLVEQLVDLEKTVRNVWEQMAGGAVKMPGEIGLMIEDYLKGEAQVSIADVRESLEAINRLLNTLFLAVGTGTHSYSVNHWQRFSPIEVGNSAEMEKRAHPSKFWQWLMPQSAANWRKYNDLCRDVSHKSIEKEIMKTIVDHAVELLRQQNAAAASARSGPIPPANATPS